MPKEMPPGKTIVCVDDDQTARFLMEKFVEHIGEFHIVSLDSGRACVDYLRQHPADLVLLDFNLGDMDGAEVCDAIADQSRNPDVPVIVISVIDSSDIVHRLNYPHLFKVVQKPYAIEEMRSDIGELLKH
jgi:two-component system chemotaxis response regulator CheY